MFVAPGARGRLLEARRERFFTEVFEPMLNEARAIGIPISAIVERVQQDRQDDTAAEGGQS